uniref:Malic enzyme n=1 Tax=Eucheuma denticulatum TaxID=305493 RepID=A0A097IUL9_9FLOR|nr:malic enzyme [Eucheuma denticulatum]|eukprot:GFKZ01011562.1.p1 GENE.GFKZ01011562.1~~GFKZ01011562.1.p1  ORF type:complete len:616 (-),score=82.70 GFKZ01011562.1:1134-2981(-)
MFRSASKAFAQVLESPRLTALRSTAGVTSRGPHIGNKSSSISRHISSEEDERSDEIVQTKHRRLSVIHDPSLNRGSGFSVDERERLLLRGLVPPRRQGLDQQIERVMKTYERQRSDLDKFQFLSLLMDRNTVLFYRILVDNFEKLAPIVYTPVVGEACQKFHAIYRRTRGMYFSLDDRQHFRTMVFNWPEDDVDVIVVTDGSRVLALGDLGCNSMNIPIGKLSLYVSGAGLTPTKTLPIVLDVGTDNEHLRDHPLYLGLPRRRLRGDEYIEVLDEWIGAIRLRWPNALIQFEDFSSDVAEVLLERYRYNDAPVFNDDIQSTGCIAVASVLASLRARGLNARDIAREVIVCAGAGSAGLGVCDAIAKAMEAEGASANDARAKFFILDENGLLGRERDMSNDSAARQKFQRKDLPDGMSLIEVIRAAKPTVLLGLSGVGGLFTEEIVKEMDKHVDRPVVFPMSNPSSASECTPEQVFSWTKGNAIYASGSPFENVELGDGRIGYSNQANNVYSFPGLGLAVTVLRISCVTDDMFLAAARRIAQLLPDEDVKKGLLFPRVGRLREISAEVGGAVGMVALEHGLVRKMPPTEVTQSLDGMVAYMRKNMWEPKYGHIVAE